MTARKRMSDAEERGGRLAREREARQWSQKHVARIIGIDSSHLSKIEKGKVPKMDRTTIAGFAAIFDKTLAWVLTGHDLPNDIFLTSTSEVDMADLYAARARVAAARYYNTPARMQAMERAFEQFMSVARGEVPKQDEPKEAGKESKPEETRARPKHRDRTRSN